MGLGLQGVVAMQNSVPVHKAYLVLSLVILILLVVSASSLAQAPDTLWLRAYGGASHEAGRAIGATLDCGCVITGYTESFGAGAADVYLLKLDASGDTAWARTYGGADYERGFSVQQTDDGGYVITGKTMSFGAGGNDVYIIRTDAAGDTLWTRTYGGVEHDVGHSIRQTHDGGYIIGAHTESFGAGGPDFYLLRTSPSGDTLWTRTYGTARTDWCGAAIETSDHGFAMVGYTDDDYMGMSNIYVVRTDSGGDTLWTKTYGDTFSYEWAYDIRQTDDGGYVVAGEYHWGDHGGETCLLKLDENGNLEWWKYHGGPGWWDCNAAFSVEIAPDGGYLLAGRAGECEFFDSDIHIIRVDSDGDTLWTKLFDTPMGPQDQAWAVCASRDGGYIVVGEINTLGSGENDVFVTKIACDVAGLEEETRTLTPVADLGLAANPVTSEALITYGVAVPGAIRLAVYDLLGREVKVLVEARTAVGTGVVRWDCTDHQGRGVSPGIYFCCLKACGRISTRRIVVVR
jgi:hypothetical protein